MRSTFLPRILIGPGAIAGAFLGLMAGYAALTIHCPQFDCAAGFSGCNRQCQDSIWLDQVVTALFALTFSAQALTHSVTVVRIDLASKRRWAFVAMSAGILAVVAVLGAVVWQGRVFEQFSALLFGYQPGWYLFLGQTIYWSNVTGALVTGLPIAVGTLVLASRYRRKV